MLEKQIAQEITALIRQHMQSYCTDRPPKITVKIPKSFMADVALLADFFASEKHGTAFEHATFCIDFCAPAVFCQDCGRQYRGPFLFDLCQRCRGSHFEPDDHLVVAIEASDRRMPHGLKKETWRITVPSE
jgi:Zn finger protein HypA/HybF involved in hydrogenase expression